VPLLRRSSALARQLPDNSSLLPCQGSVLGLGREMLAGRIVADRSAIMAFGSRSEPRLSHCLRASSGTPFITPRIMQVHLITVPHSAQSAPLAGHVLRGPERITERKGIKILRGQTELRAEQGIGKMSLTREGFPDINRRSPLREFSASRARGPFYVLRALVTGRGPRAGAGHCNFHYRVSRID